MILFFFLCVTVLARKKDCILLFLFHRLGEQMSRCFLVYVVVVVLLNTKVSISSERFSINKCFTVV